ncbi:DUF1868-domain-containing protein [Echria macrotheca]|uniref:DUF1868-domain-containing protein n=1 Tax=Echria macrotheca TaxID=438768 RepID=A0AAJ0F0U7_9PEZI|nr:DUF1868-domain-containing protein [Echria macrotheca]
MRGLFRDNLAAVKQRLSRTSSEAQNTMSTFHVNRPQGYPAGVPSKFDPDGNVQRFRGNTIVSHLSPDSPLYASLLELHAKLAASPLAHLYALLPPESWHMTVFECTCEDVRMRGYWPEDVPMDAPLEDCTAHLAAKLGEFDLGADARPPYRFTVRGFSPFDVGIGVLLRLRTPEEEFKFRILRQRLADKTRILQPNHNHYQLHISMAYFLRHLDEAQKAELGSMLMDHFQAMDKDFELGAPEFCTFENMFRFDRLFYLENKD